MRALLATLFLVLVAGCPSAFETRGLAEDGDNVGSGSGAGSGGLQAECSVAADCVAAGPKCCDCPTHSIPSSDPSQQACGNVDCAPATCGSPMQAACEAGQCVLECTPVACDENVSCPNGFATDSNGCLVCGCAAVASTECSADTDCERVKADCCGCAMGGNDTAVPTTAVTAHNAKLMCTANPSCPAVDTCAPDLAARCVQGQCELVAGVLPPNACGRADLAPCMTGERCTVNQNDQATMQGVGVCQVP